MKNSISRSIANKLYVSVSNNINKTTFYLFEIKYISEVMSKSIVSYKAFLTCLGQELTWNQLQILKAKEGWKIEVHDYGEGVVHHCIKPVEWQDISEKKITFDEDPEKDRVWTFNPVAVAIGLAARWMGTKV